MISLLYLCFAVFNYNNSRHNVFKVNGTLFQNCTVPPANEALTSGNDVIPIKSEGRKWYICGKADHCSAHQMKFVIHVDAEAAPAPSPTSAAHTSVVSSVFGVAMVAMVTIAAIFA